MLLYKNFMQIKLLNCTCALQTDFNKYTLVFIVKIFYLCGALLTISVILECHVRNVESEKTAAARVPGMMGTQTLMMRRRPARC